MSDALREAAQQALVALVHHTDQTRPIQRTAAAIAALRAALSAPAPAPAEAVAIEALAHRIAWRYKKSSDPNHSDTYTFNRATLLQFAAALAALSAPAPTTPPAVQAPAPLTDERLDSLIEKHLRSYWSYGAFEQDKLRRAVREIIGAAAQGGEHV